jgi:AraC-like DNA-binding protein
MKFDFSSVAKPVETSSLSIRTVYILFADQTYDVLKDAAGNEDWVALRTMEGTGCLKFEGSQDLAVSANTLLVFRHRDVRRYFCSGDSWNFFWFEFAIDGTPLIPTDTVLQIDAVENELADCHACMEMLRGNEEGSSRLASATLNLLLCKWARDLEKGGKESHYHDAVQRVVTYMNANLEKRITVKSMAEKAGFSERRFRQIFELVKSMPPKQYLEALRLKMAEALLQNTSLSILSISDRLGYCSQFHFSKRFQAAYHMSPSQYRKPSHGKTLNQDFQ